MRIAESYRPQQSHHVCREHYDGTLPLPADAPSLGQVLDARDTVPCEFCEAQETAQDDD